jgi:hypothetical protein
MILRRASDPLRDALKPLRDESGVKGLEYNHLLIGMTLWVRLGKAMTKGCWSLTEDRAYK